MLVSIGIPAYNRPEGLATAVRSALAQDWQAVEVVVSDDASPDPAVAGVLSELAAGDKRVRVLRQRENLGHAANYRTVLEAATGDYFMWLSDDDWIDERYVRRCLEALLNSPGAVLVCGQARYYEEGRHVFDERPTELAVRSPGRRVARYFATVSLNGALFGLARTAELRSLGFPEVIGGDWMLVGELASRGHVLTLADVHIHRSTQGLGGASHALARSFGLGGLSARQPHVLISVAVARRIAAGRGGFAILPSGQRVPLAAFAAGCILVRFTLADLLRCVIGERASRRLEAWVGRRLHRSSG